MPKYFDMLRNHKPDSPNRANAAQDKLVTEEELLTSQASSRQPASETSGPGRTTSREPVKTEPPATDDIITNPDVWLNRCSRIMLSFLKAAASNRVVPIEKLWLHLKPQLTAVINNEKQLSALELKVSEDTLRIREMSDEFGGMLEKSMNMLLLSIKMGLQLRMSEEATLSLLLAAMLHHIGLAQVPIAIRQKSSALTREERQTIRGATHQGVGYLRDCGITDADTLLAIEQSQERIDGSGPLGLQGTEISYMGRIIGLLSFFEALIHYRPYRQRMLPRDAIRDIILHHKAAFDTSLLKALIDAASLYPIGTYVQLNSGDIGQVIHVHPRLPLRPTVLLSMDRKGQPIVQREIDLQVQTTLLVERCMYPEDIDQAL